MAHRVGQPIEWLRLNPLVRVEADEVLSHTEWRSVVVLGRYKEFRDIPEHLEEILQVQARLEQVNQLWWDTGFAAAQARGRLDRDMTIFLLHSHPRDHRSLRV